MTHFATSLTQAQERGKVKYFKWLLLITFWTLKRLSEIDNLSVVHSMRLIAQGHICQDILID